MSHTTQWYEDYKTGNDMEDVVAYFNILFQHLPGGTKETIKTVSIQAKDTC
jgi:hypothetical protein